MDEDQGRTTVGYPVQFCSDQSQFPPGTVAAAPNAAGAPETSNHNRENRTYKMSSKEKIITILAFVCVFSIFLLFYIVQSVDDMKFRSPDFKVELVTVDPFNISSSSSLTANWSITFSVKNPDFHDISFNYEDMEASVLLKGENICSKMMANFFLDGSKNKQEKVLQDNFAVSSVRINQRVAEGLIAEKREKGTFTFSFKVECTGTMYRGHGNTKRRKMIALCENLKVRFISDDDKGTLMAGLYLCHVNVHKMD